MTSALVATCFAATPYLITSKVQSKLTPMQVLESMQKGNNHYVSGSVRSHDHRAHAMLASKKGQAPIAFILSCVDSRSIPEITFDQSAGAFFVARNAGNVIGTSVLGSMEFATQYAGTKLIVIMGHTQCGAVQGACQHVNKPANLYAVLDKIQLAVSQTEKRESKTVDCDKASYINSIAKQNVLNQIQSLYHLSPATAKLAAEKKIMIVGAMHNIRTGKVVFFDDHGKNITLSRDKH